MAQIKASIKSIRKDIKITAANASVKSEIRTAVKRQSLLQVLNKKLNLYVLQSA